MTPQITPISLGTCLLSISILGLTAPPATAFPDPGTLLLTQSGAVLTVDPATGDRTELSGFSAGTGVSFSSRPNDLVREESGHFVVSDFDVQALIRVDGTTGDRTLLASSSVGTGGSFRPGALEIDGDTHFDPGNFGTLLVWNVITNVIERVDPVSGDRTVVVSGSAGGAPILSAVQDILRIGPGYSNMVGEYLNDLVVSDSNLDALVLVSTFTGERRVLSSASVGTGPVFDTPRGIAMVPPPNFAVGVGLTFYVVDSGVGAVFAVTDHGDREIVSSSSVGTGPDFELPWNVWPSADGKALYVTDAELEAVFYVDLATGNRTIVADASTGSGPALNAVKSFTAVPAPWLAWGFEDEVPGNPPAYTVGAPPSLIEGIVRVQKETDFAGSVQAAEGSQLLYLTSGPGNRGETSGTSQFDESQLVLPVYRGQNAARRLSLAVDFLTHEGPKPDPADVLAAGFNAIWLLQLGHLSVQTVNPGSSPYPFTGPYTALTGFAEAPITGPDGSVFGNGHVGYRTYEVDVDFPGVLLMLRVADQTDPHDDTAMLVDDIRFVPEPGTSGLAAGMLLTGALARRRRARRAAA